MRTPPDPLSTVLQTWQSEPTAAPTFQADVWARIEAARQTDRSAHSTRWLLPLAASFAVLAGASAGFYRADRQHDERMASALVRSVDPLQMAGAHHHTP